MSRRPSVPEGRCPQNPILQPADVPPSSPEFVVRGVFNPAAALISNISDPTEHLFILVLRVSESYPANSYDSVAELHVPVARPSSSPSSPDLSRVVISRADEAYDTNADSRVILNTADRRVAYLTSISHLRVARSSDGVRFAVDEKPLLFPGQRDESSVEHDDGDDDEEKLLQMEEWGVEDARVVLLEDFDPLAVLPKETAARIVASSSSSSSSSAPLWHYAVTYTAVSRYGAATALALTTREFRQVRRVGIIFPPENKDVCLFPQRLQGHWYCYHRPVPRSFGNPDMWCAMSDNLVSWGLHKHILGSSDPSKQSWDCGRVGGGAPSVLCERGWLHVYHAANTQHQYCLGVFLADAKNPGKIIARSKQPILSPTEPYERIGFFRDVVFACGVLLLPGASTSTSGEKDGDRQLLVYYGAADDKVALCTFRLKEIYRYLDQD